MGLFQFKSNEKDKEQVELFLDTILGIKSEQLKIKQLAIEHAIDLIARTISKCEIKYYKYDSKTNKVIEDKNNDTYYKLNIKPNENEVATSFFYMVICSLLREDKSLLVTKGKNKDLFFSRDFVSTEFVTKANTYSNIKVEDTLGNTELLTGTFNEKDVINFRLGNSKIKETIDNYFDEYKKFINASSLNFRLSNIPKFRLKFPGGQPSMRDPVTKEEITYEDYKKKITEGLFSNEEALILLSEQFGLEKLNGDKIQNSEDYRNLLKKWSDDVAMEFNIPLDVFYGSKTDKSTGTNDFITFAIDPVIEIIEDNLNAKLISKENYIKGEKFVINKLNIKHFDIFDVAGPIDKLSANGFSHNDNRGFLGLPTVPEKWADEHRFTKNYADSKGGDE